MPKFTVDPRSVLAISPGRLNALRVLEDELQLLRQQSVNHPEYLGLMPGMELEITRIRQATGTAAPEPQPEPEQPAEPNSDYKSISFALVQFLQLLQKGAITARDAGRMLGTSANAVTMKASGLRKAGYDIQCINGKYTLVGQPEKPAEIAGDTPSNQQRVMNYMRAHPEFTAQAMKQDLGLIGNRIYTAMRDAKTKYGWKIESIGFGEYRLIKEGRKPGKPGGDHRSKRRIK